MENLATLTDRLNRLEATIRQQEERQIAHQLVLSWLLANQPDGIHFLRDQANEVDQPGCRDKFPEHIALLDELREDVAQWHELRGAGNTPPR